MQIAMQIDADDDADQLNTLHRHLHRVCIELHRNRADADTALICIAHALHRYLHRPLRTHALHRCLHGRARCGFSAMLGAAFSVLGGPHCEHSMGCVPRSATCFCCIVCWVERPRHATSRRRQQCILSPRTHNSPSLPSNRSTPAPARRLLYASRSLPTPPHPPPSRQTVVVVAARLVATRRMPNSLPTKMCSCGNAWCSGASCLDRILNASAQNVAVAATSMYLSYTQGRKERPQVLSALLTSAHTLQPCAPQHAERARPRTIPFRECERNSTAVGMLSVRERRICSWDSR